jgi:hypothetical protein
LNNRLIGFVHLSKKKGRLSLLSFKMPNLFY